MDKSRTSLNFGPEISGDFSTNVRKCCIMKKKDSLTHIPPGDDEESQMNLLWLEEDALSLTLVPSIFV